MGGSSTYGIVQNNGSVVYNIYRDTVFNDSILYEFKMGRSVEIILDDLHYANSIEDYYSEQRYVDEDSIVRGLLRLDGTLEYKYWGAKEVITYTR